MINQLLSTLLLSLFRPSRSQYNYTDLTSSYHLKWNGKCTSVPSGLNYNYRKGKSYEINHESYLAFRVCRNSFSCDKNVEHAVRLDDYFKATSGCVADHCSQCSNEECTANCEKYALMAEATSDNGNSTYNGCSATTSSEGLKYYYGPQCTDDGDMTMGYFFDMHCQLNATRRGDIYSPEDFVSFDVFNFVQSICSQCSYFGVCEDIYTTSYSCTTSDGTLLSIGDNIIEIEEEQSGEEYGADGVERRTAENNEDTQEEGFRTTTLSYAEAVCLKVNAIEHLHEELLRNSTAHYLKEGGIALKELSMILCGIGVVLGVGFLFVAHTYHARHKSSWATSKRGALNDEFFNEGKSFDEISCGSTDAGFSPVKEHSYPLP